MKQTNKEIMSTIYKENLWGGRGQAFYSGQGSHKDKIMGPYIKALKEWLTTFEEKLHVCDLGCGDFNVGNQLGSVNNKPKSVFFTLFPYFFVRFSTRSTLCLTKTASKSEKIIKKPMVFV